MAYAPAARSEPSRQPRSAGSGITPMAVAEPIAAEPAAVAEPIAAEPAAKPRPRRAATAARPKPARKTSAKTVGTKDVNKAADRPTRKAAAAPQTSDDQGPGTPKARAAASRSRVERKQTTKRTPPSKTVRRNTSSE